MKKRKKGKLIKRFVSILLMFALLVTYLPTSAFAASDDLTRISDTSTMDGWKNYFGSSVLSTENAGGVWTDKSVFTDASAFEGTGITRNSEDSFLVALSAIASNRMISGLSNVPTDTMLVLDVSGSMNDNKGNNDVAEELVEAANESIAKLLSMNKYNRVGVVLYSGPTTVNGAASSTDAVLILPLGRYTTGTDGEYLSYTVTGKENTTETVSLDSDVLMEGTTTKPSSQSKKVEGATYIQKGIILAKDQFTAASNSVTVEDSVLGTLTRTPVVVLMSDGAPTISTTNFTSPESYNLGDGQASSTSAAQGFVTQLSAAYAKQQIEAKYGTDCLFYTLGLGVSGNTIATSVLDPANSSTAINEFWSRYHSASVDGTVTVQGSGQNAKKVTKISEKLEQNYVDEYFKADGSNSTLAEELKKAFADIVGTIQLQSKYFPTLISENEDISGYVSFVDRIGEYMEVTDVKGILIHNTLFSGADLASNFISGGGKLGTYDAPTDLGNEMVWAVQQRLGISDVDTARTLIGLAYEYGQLSYTSDTEYSNYIGWYANAAGEFLGFYQEGVTVLPESTGDAATDPVFTIKSYGYLGEVDAEHGVAESDMMYVTVQVRENIATGEQTVAFAVPAALIPIVTYNVTLNENKELSELTVTGAEHPIRLIYEVALDDAINEYTLKDVVSAEYLANNTNADGSINFYTNQYDHNNATGYGTVNTYSYFNPSRQNEKYYYTEDTLVYADDQGTLYTGDTKPSGDMYRSYTVYKKEGSRLITETSYRKISDEVLSTATKNENTNNWYIPQGSVHVNMDGYTVNKAENETNTLQYANIPFVDTHNHTVGELGYNFYVGATLGNNGKLTMVPETGIKITKEMKASAATPDEAFTFVLTNTTDPEDDTEYPAYFIAADGTKTETTVKFSEGKAVVTLNPKDTLYIGGMTAGEIIKVEENETADYIVESVNGDAGLKTAAVTLNANEIISVEFVNADRGKGNLTVAKEIEHDFGTDYQIPADKSFEMTVTLTGAGTKNATFTAVKTNSDLTSVTTDANGQFTVTLKHEEQITIYNLPEGTEATVVEQAPGEGFTAQYWDNGVLGDGKVTVAADTTASVLVINDYTAEKVYPVNITVSGTKTLIGRNWDADDSFTFELQKLVGENQWSALGTAAVTGSDADKEFDFNGAFANEEYTVAGTYYYRVIEIEPTTGALGGVTYDKTVHAFAVDVADADMDGKLEISAVRAFRESTNVSQPTSDSWNVNVDFINSYAAKGTATVTIDLNKKVTNESGSTLAKLNGFKFGLYDKVTDELQFESEETTDRGFARLVMEYKTAGTYEYILREMIPDPVPAGWNYSNVEIPVTVVVTDTGEGYFDAVIYKGNTGADNAGTSISTEFTNIYEPQSTELAIDFVDKSISGRTLKADEFTFEVQELDGTIVLEGTNDVSGNVNFDDVLKFDKVGTYYYNIVETSEDGKGVTTDRNVYRVIVTVTDNNGQLSAGYVLVNIAGDNIVFQNTYTADDVSYAIGGNKTLNGRVLLNDEFTFVMTEAADENGTIAADAKSYESKNFADGSVKFPEITYTEAGTYYYVISETANGGSNYGIKYDTTEFVVTIEITDNGEGNLVVSSVNYEVKGGDAVSGISFVNEYIPNPTSAQIPGNKTLNGKVLSGDDFAFELYSSDADWTTGTKLETVQNAQDGSFTFTTIDYDTAGTYYYLVKEVNGGQVIDGVTYDDTVYRVRIDITDDLKGQLHSSVHVYDSYDIPQESVLFINVYEITGDGSVTLEGEKTLNGRNMTDDEFTFELYETNEEFSVSGTADETTTNKDGKFAFEVTYDVSDVGKTFYYVVKEQNAGETIDGIVYSSTEYHITVVVEDDGVGGIKTTKTIKDGENDASSLDFINDCVGDLVITKDVDFLKDGSKINASLDGRENKEYSFTVTFGDGTKETFTLKAGESRTIEDIPYGTAYTVTEETTGMVFISSIKNGTGTIEAAAANVEVTNTYEYKTRVNAGFNAVKVDADTGKALAGAEFTLYEDSACEKVVATAVSDKDGKVHFDITAEGTYYLKETKAPEGYYLSSTVYTVTAETEYVEILTGENAPYIEERLVIRADGLTGTTEDDIDYVYTVTNHFLKVEDVPGGFTVLKVDAETGEALEGAVFVLYDKDGKEAARAATDADGKAEFGPFTQDAEYTLKEESAPVYYEKTDSEWKVTVILKDGDPTVKIEKDETTGKDIFTSIYNWIVDILKGTDTADSTWNGDALVLTVENTKKTGDLVITKDVDFLKDGSKINASLDGRENKEYSFTVTFGDGTKETFTLKAGESRTIEDIPYGTAYTVTEETTGMVFISSIKNGTGTIEAATTNVEVTNTYEYKTRVNAGFNAVKVDADTGKALEGAEFTLYEDAACEKVVATAVSDSDGKVHFDITAEGTYYLKETKAPEGYYLSDVVYTVTAELEYVEIIDESGEELPYIEERLIIKGDGLRGTTEDEMDYIYTIDNTSIKYYDVSVEKKWNVPIGITLPGSIEVVLYKDGVAYETVQLSAENNWSYKWTGLSEEYTWTVDEVKVPNGFAKKVECEGYDFTITNTYTEIIQQMGDNMAPTFFGMGLLIAGAGVLFMAIRLRRREDEQELA